MAEESGRAVSIEVQAYKDVMSNFPAGVTIVTTTDADGAHYGLTLSAFTSVSIDPPLILIVVDKKSVTLPHLKENGAFTVNVLRAGTDSVALGFAATGGDKFVHVDQDALIDIGTGPVLGDVAIAYLSCRIGDEIEAGDHWILLGEVEAGEVLNVQAPLIYCARQFDTLASSVLQDAGDNSSI